MRRAIIVTSAITLCLGTIASVGTTQAAESRATDVVEAGTLNSDIALSGTFVGGEFAADLLTVGIKQGDWRDLPEGSSFEVYQVPQEGVHASGSSWWVTLDPITVPNRFVASDGQVDFLIEGHDPASGASAYHTVSALRISDVISRGTGWLRAGATIPTGWVALPGLAPASTPASAPAPAQPILGTDPGTDDLEVNDQSMTTAVDTGALSGIPLEILSEPSSVASDDGQTGDTDFLLAKPSIADFSMKKTAPWNCQEIAGNRGDIQTTIATGYPVNGDASSLTYDATMKTTSGSAISTGGGWSESGTESTTDGWGADFGQDTRKRSYRTAVTYGLYDCRNAAGYDSYWVFPIKQPGAAYYYYLSSAPNWTQCQPVGNNVTWKRTKTDGNDYELSYGVKAKSYIGIEMFSRHGYSTGSMLRYHVTHGNKRVCGNNDTPGQAGKVQEKY